MQRLVWQNSNGDEINLTSGNYGITNWEGFANTSLNIQSQQVPFQDGGVFLDALMEQRELSVTLAMYDGGNLETRYRMRRELMHVLNPKLGEGYLIYTNDFISKRIKCVAQIPLFETHNSNDSGTPKASLSWTASEPYWEDLEETEILMESNVNKQIENNGDYITSLKADVYCIGAKNIQIENISQNKKIQLNGSFEGIVNIDTRNGNKIVTRSYYKGLIALSDIYIEDVCYNSDDNYYLICANGKCIKTKNFNDYEIYSNSYNFSKIHYFKEKKLFMGISSTAVLSSEDGINWNEYVASITNVIFVNEFIAWGISSGNTNIYRSIDGIEWTQTTVNSIALKQIVYSKEFEMFVGLSSDTIYTSENLETFTSRKTAGSYETYYFVGNIDGVGFSVVYHYRRYSGGYEDFIKFLYSRNGIDWDNASSSGDVRESGNVSLAWSNKGFYLLNNASTNGLIYYSVMGEYWERLKNTGSYYSKIKYFDNISDFLIYSYNKIDSVINQDIQYLAISAKDICYNNKQKKYTLITTNKVYESYDLIKFTEVLSINYNYFEEIYYIKEKGIYFITETSREKYYYSIDGVNWTERTIMSIYYPKSITYIKKLDRIFFIGNNLQSEGIVWYGNDGLTWQQGWTDSIPSEPFNSLYNLAYSEKNDLLVLSGNGKAYSSVDGGAYWHTRLDMVSNASYIYYNPYTKKIYSSRSVTDNGTNWVLINRMDLEAMVYAEDINVYVGYKNTDVYVSYDVQKWGIIVLNITGITQFSKIRYNSEMQSFYLIATIAGSKCIIQIKAEVIQNIISKLTLNTDMRLGLELGTNNIKISCEEGLVQAIIKYRQKYIGV